MEISQINDAYISGEQLPGLGRKLNNTNRFVLGVLLESELNATIMRNFYTFSPDHYSRLETFLAAAMRRQTYPFGFRNGFCQALVAIGLSVDMYSNPSTIEKGSSKFSTNDIKAIQKVWDDILSRTPSHHEVSVTSIGAHRNNVAGSIGVVAGIAQAMYILGFDAEVAKVVGRFNVEAREQTHLEES